jgi:8-oxo-dGTP diphosphatase
VGLPKTPLLTTDCVLCDPAGRVLLVRRKNEPFEGAYALPGGFVDIGETVEAACRREVAEETGLAVSELRLVGVYSDPRRDPFVAALPGGAWPKAGSDAAVAEWIEDWRGEKLAFDHAQIIEDALKR